MGDSFKGLLIRFSSAEASRLASTPLTPCGVHACACDQGFCMCHNPSPFDFSDEQLHQNEMCSLSVSVIVKITNRASKIRKRHRGLHVRCCVRYCLRDIRFSSARVFLRINLSQDATHILAMHLVAYMLLQYRASLQTRVELDNAVLPLSSTPTSRSRSSRDFG